MSESRVEALLARLYVDEVDRRRFLADPADWVRCAGLTGADAASIAALDPRDLEVAAQSFAAKRARRDQGGRGWWRRWASHLLGALSRRNVR